MNTYGSINNQRNFMSENSPLMSFNSIFMQGPVNLYKNILLKNEGQNFKIQAKSMQNIFKNINRNNPASRLGGLKTFGVDPIQKETIID